MGSGYLAPQAPWWSDRNLLKRFVVDLITGELSRLRPGWAPSPGPAWDDRCAIDTDLGADSLELMQLATALSQMLHTHETGIEDYFLMRRTLGDWVDIAAAGLDGYAAKLSFVTSGSTGIPKTCSHTLAALLQEASTLSTLFHGTKRLLFAVPSHHIYGFLFTILLPEMLRLDSRSVIDLRETIPSGLPARAAPGDLVVAHPEFWRAAVRCDTRYTVDVTGVTSTGPCAEDICDALTAAGVSRLVQIYGSSETAGIGWRNDPRAAYALFPYWSVDLARPEYLIREGPDGCLTSIAVQDRIDWIDERHFSVGLRHDAGVQVGGVNVFPTRVADLLKQHRLVADAVVRLMRLDEGNRLKAYVVLAPTARDALSATRELRSWIDAVLPVAQRPKALTIGPALPTTVMGKPCDWLITDL